MKMVAISIFDDNAYKKKSREDAHVEILRCWWVIMTS